MTFKKNLISQGNGIFFVSIMTLQFAPHQYKWPGLAVLYFGLILAVAFDWKKNTRLVRRITRRVASCGCVKARETISHIQLPQMLRISCTVCGAEAS